MKNWACVEAYLGRLHIAGVIGAPPLAVLEKLGHEARKQLADFVNDVLCGGAAARASRMPLALKKAMRHALPRQKAFLEHVLRCAANGRPVSQGLIKNGFGRACIGRADGSGAEARLAALAKGDGDAAAALGAVQDEMRAQGLLDGERGRWPRPVAAAAALTKALGSLLSE
jgi:hypothetical protein